MSYIVQRPVGGLGQVPTGQLAPLRSFDSLPKEGVRWDILWALVDDDPTLQTLKDRLVAFRAMAPEEPLRDPDGRLRDTSPFINSMRNYWTRASSNPNLWPGVRADQWFNFGPNNGDSRQLRISQAMWELLNGGDTQRPWKATDAGFVRLRPSDRLYNTIIRDRLRALGYIDSSVDASIADDSVFVAALKRYWQEARDGGADLGPWAGDPGSGGCPTSSDAWGNCYNFGPNTSGEIRLSPQLLDSLVNTVANPRTRVAAQGFTSGLANLRTRPPVITAVGALQPSAALNRPSPAVMKSALRAISPTPLLAAALKR
jgi:hypothetical protein